MKCLLEPYSAVNMVPWTHLIIGRIYNHTYRLHKSTNCRYFQQYVELILMCLDIIIVA